MLERTLFLLSIFVHWDAALSIFFVFFVCFEETEKFSITQGFAAKTQLIVVIHIPRFRRKLLIQLSIVKVLIILINEPIVISLSKLNLEDLLLQRLQYLRDFRLNRFTVREVYQLNEPQPLIEPHKLGHHNDGSLRRIIPPTATPQIRRDDLIHDRTVMRDQYQRLQYPLYVHVQ